MLNGLKIYFSKFKVLHKLLIYFNSDKFNFFQLTKTFLSLFSTEYISLFPSLGRQN